MKKFIFENKVVQPDETHCLWFPDGAITDHLPPACSSGGQRLPVEDENGTPFTLTCEKKTKGMCFTKGWKDFCDATSITVNDRIIFYKEDDPFCSGAETKFIVKKN